MVIAYLHHKPGYRLIGSAKVLRDLILRHGKSEYRRALQEAADKAFYHNCLARACVCNNAIACDILALSTKAGARRGRKS